MLGIWEYPQDFLAEVHAHAEQLGIDVWKGLRFRNATDGVIALKAGYPALSIGSCDEFKIPSNYHWPSDVPGEHRLRHGGRRRGSPRRSSRGARARASRPCGTGGRASRR